MRTGGSAQRDWIGARWACGRSYLGKEKEKERERRHVRPKESIKHMKRRKVEAQVYQVGLHSERSKFHLHPFAPGMVFGAG